MSNPTTTIHVGDALEVLRTLPSESVDAVVTDPPYGLKFMGKDWDRAVPNVEYWAEALRVAKPGAHMLAFGGTRLYHRLTCAIEDAGWEIRDCLMWVYAEGFPKSLDVSKAIDKEAGAVRDVVAIRTDGCGNTEKSIHKTNGFATSRDATFDETAPATAAAKTWNGWGTALKPAWEPIILARKPLDGNVAQNVQKHGVGALNIDGCRVGLNGEENPSIERRKSKPPVNNVWGDKRSPESYARERPAEALGRWPTNLIHDGSEEVVQRFPDDASRMFYCPKASSADRGNEVMRALPLFDVTETRNTHPTVKPTTLMAYLCRLVTPPGGLILDMFCGSGSTGVAAVEEGFRFVGIELNPEYADLARKRIDAAGTLFGKVEKC